MTGSKRCRVKLAYGNYRVGDYIWPTGALRDELMGRGFIELAPETEAALAIERAVIEPEQALKRRGPGRPRKIQTEV